MKSQSVRCIWIDRLLNPSRDRGGQVRKRAGKARGGRCYGPVRIQWLYAPSERAGQTVSGERRFRRESHEFIV